MVRGLGDRVWIYDFEDRGGLGMGRMVNFMQSNQSHKLLFAYMRFKSCLQEQASHCKPNTLNLKPQIPKSCTQEGSPSAWGTGGGGFSSSGFSAGAALNSEHAGAWGVGMTSFR